MNAAAVQQVHGGARPRRDQRDPAVTATGLARLAGAVLVAGAMIVVVLALTMSPAQPRPVSWSAVSVEHTGTLWEIAAEHAVGGLSTAETVDLIRQENNLSSSTLYAGQTLVVPATASDTLSVAQR